MLDVITVRGSTRALTSEEAEVKSASADAPLGQAPHSLPISALCPVVVFCNCLHLASRTKG